MSENVTLFPNILQPAAALKAYAPIAVKFWENQETALEDLYDPLRPVGAQHTHLPRNKWT